MELDPKNWGMKWLDSHFLTYVKDFLFFTQNYVFLKRVACVQSFFVIYPKFYKN